MHSPQCQTFRPFMTLFNTLASDTLSQQLPQGPGFPGTVTNGFPSVTSVLQHLVFKMSFHDVLFTAPSPSPGCDEKVILIFQRSPINYSTGLCIVYSLHCDSFCKNYQKNLLVRGNQVYWTYSIK